MFQDKLGLKEAHGLKYLLSRMQPNINYEENILSIGIYRGLGNVGLSQPPEKDAC